jgi:CheY-like chemotaxis protein
MISYYRDREREGVVSKKVLIVEDVADVRMMMKILIQTHGFETVLARDGYEAVEKAIEFRPDLILMDLMLPIMDGFVATQMIREHEELRKIPILALTAYSDMLNGRALEVGFDDVISKPLEFEKLKPLLNQYITK